MEKAKVPTTRYQVFCDTFDMKGQTEIHLAGKKKKLLITLEDENGDKKQLSLYREDAEMLASSINSQSFYLDYRNE